MANAYYVDPTNKVAKGMPTIMEKNLEKLSSLLIDLETVNEERLASLSKGLNDLLAFERRVVKQQDHLKLPKFRGCVMVRDEEEDYNPMMIRGTTYVTPWKVNTDFSGIDDVAGLCDCLLKMIKFYNSCKKDHVSTVETQEYTKYIPLEEIKLYAESLDDFIKGEKFKITSFAPTVCMLRGCKKGFAYKFPSQHLGEKRKEKVMCLECQFAFFDKNIAEISLKEDLCAGVVANGKEEDLGQGEKDLKKRKVDTLCEKEV